VPGLRLLPPGSREDPGAALGSVKSHVVRGRERLREAMRGRHERRRFQTDGNTERKPV
jgi:hypothetical protein